MRFSALAVLCVLALTACSQEAQQQDPLSDDRAACADEGRPAADRVGACSALIDSGELTPEERAAAQAQRGVAYRESGQITPALRDFEAVLREDENNAAALEGRAAILLASGQLDSATALVERLLATGERQDAAHLMKGDIALRQGDYAAAIESYDAALQQNGRLALALAHRGRAKQRQDNAEGALADYDAALRIQSDLPDARAGRCWLSLMAQEHLDRARSDAETAVAGEPGNIEAQLCRGVLQLRGGEWDGARTSFNTVLATQPGNPIALFGRGVARRRGGESEGTQDMNQARDFDRHIGATFDDWGVRTF